MARYSDHVGLWAMKLLAKVQCRGEMRNVKVQDGQIWQNDGWLLQNNHRVI